MEFLPIDVGSVAAIAKGGARFDGSVLAMVGSTQVG